MTGDDQTKRDGEYLLRIDSIQEAERQRQMKAWEEMVEAMGAAALKAGLPFSFSLVTDEIKKATRG